MVLSLREKFILWNKWLGKTLDWCSMDIFYNLSVPVPHPHLQNVFYLLHNLIWMNSVWIDFSFTLFFGCCVSSDYLEWLIGSLFWKNKKSQNNPVESSTLEFHVGLRAIGTWGHFRDWLKCLGSLFVDEEVVSVFLCGCWDLMMLYL